MAMLPAILPTIASTLKDIINRVIPDKVAAQAAEMQMESELLKSQQEGALKTLEAQLQDVQSARERQMSVKDKVPGILAFLLIGSYVGILLMQMIGIQFPQSVITQSMTNQLGNLCLVIISYYFGSSIGSKQKDDHIKELSKNIINKSDA